MQYPAIPLSRSDPGKLCTRVHLFTEQYKVALAKGGDAVKLAR